MRRPQRLDGVIGDLREGEDTKIPGRVALFVLGLLFFVQSVIVAVVISLQKFPGQSLDSLTGSMFGCLGCWLWAWYLSGASHRKRWLKVALIALVAIFACVGLTLTAIQFFHDRQVEAQAKQWFTQAQEDARPTWTENDAIRWLHDHDIKPHRSVDANEIGGHRQIEEGGRIFTPVSVHISFLFDPVHKFRRVQCDVEPFVLPDRWQ
jgi:hypothetical protein